MDTLLNKFKLIDNKKINKLLTYKQNQTKPDSKVGIFIVEITDNELNVKDQGYFIYAARVLPKNSDRQNYVQPHYHKYGNEPYLLLTNEHGEMNVCPIINESVDWNDNKTRRFIVKPNSIVIVKQNEVHSFRNLSDKPFDFLFAYPKSHLKEDRYFIDILPPWYD